MCSPQNNSDDASIEPSRRLILDGAFNFRDLGGYETVTGKTLKWRTLFRSDDLFRLSIADYHTFEAIGIRTVVDLRTDVEANQRGRFALDGTNISYYQHSLPDISVESEDDEEITGSDYIFHRYKQILLYGTAQIVEVLALLSNRNNIPAVFHCAVGKDRTGLMAALILDSVGVDRSQILDDYALSAQSIEAMLCWLDKQLPQLGAQIRALPAAVMKADPENLLRVLQWIDKRWGGTAKYLREIGVTSTAMANLNRILLSN